MSCICTSVYLGRIISPVAGFCFSIFLLMFISHFGSDISPVFGLYSMRLCFCRFVRISWRFFWDIFSFLDKFSIVRISSSSMIVRRSAVVSICVRFIFLVY